MSKIALRMGVGLLLTVASLAAQATVYRYIDEYGNLIYSNVPPTGIPDAEPLSPAAPVRANRARHPGTPTPASFPRVDAGTQRDRDVQRRRILEEELSEERSLLRRASASGTPDAADQHRRNVEALEKELTFLRR